MDKYIGRLLDNRYEILEVIGTGGMAVVYKARCHRLNRLVAIKILKDDYLEDEEFRRRFHSESQAVAMLSHPNIVSVYDVSTSVTADYIVMELIDGITLKQYMEKKGVLNWKETLHFAIQIAKALEHAHSRGIVHRDIKPHNIMVLKNGSVKVTDFGIARMMSKGNTLTKEALGSVHYISPEQAKGGRVDSRSDIYSLGVVMYEMMSGRPPYDGESPVTVAIQHINGGAVMPSTLNHNIPGGLEQIIMKAMALEPSARYASAAAMLADLDEFRKNPAILFDYNTPPTDAVTSIPKSPHILESEEPRTTAQRVERKANPERRTPDGAQNRVQSRQVAQRRREAEEAQKRSKVATIAIISCSVVMVVAIVIFLVVLLGGNGSLVEVPSLVGEIYEDLPEYKDFKIKLGKEVYDEKYAAGQIIEQEPAAGKKVKKNEKIYVTVSLGPASGETTMFEFAGWELSEAERALNTLSMKLMIRVIEEYHDTVAEGAVIRTDPVAGTQLEVGQNVTLYVSLGKEIKTSTMPNVIGYPENHAKSILEDQNLDLEIVTEEIFDSEKEIGNIVKTDPEPGKDLKTGQKVTLYISKGPELKTLPDVLERNIADAVSMLATANFDNYETETATSDQEKDTVVALKVDGKVVNPGDKVDVNKKITIVVSGGKETTKTQTIAIPTKAELDGLGFDESDYTKNGKVSFVLKLQQGSTVYYTSGTLNFESSTIQITLKGSGIQVYELLLNGKKFRKVEVDFTA